MSSVAPPRDLQAVALDALADVAGDQNAPAAARVQAASALLNFTGGGGRGQGVGDAVGDMDLGQIDAALAVLSGSVGPPAS